MTGDKDGSSPLLTTIPQQEVEQGSDSTMSPVSFSYLFGPNLCPACRVPLFVCDCVDVDLMVDSEMRRQEYENGLGQRGDGGVHQEKRHQRSTWWQGIATFWLSLLVFCSTVPFSLVSLAGVVEGETLLFGWDSDGTWFNSSFFSNTATYTSDSADHRERDEVDQDFSFITSLQHFEAFEKDHFISTVHSMSFTSSGSLCRVGRPLQWKTSKPTRCWTLEHPDQLEVT